MLRQAVLGEVGWSPIVFSPFFSYDSVNDGEPNIVITRIPEQPQGPDLTMSPEVLAHPQGFNLATALRA